MRIYLDHNATTPLDPLVADRMAQALREVWGNASSVHHFGQQAKAALDEARGSVGALIGADASEIVFTAGGTESDNLAIRGAAEAIEPSGRKHLVDQRDRARSRAQHHEGARAPRLARHGRARRCQRHRLDRSHARRGHRRHRARLGDAREQRDRHHPADRRNSPPSPTNAARCFTPTRCRAPARSRSTSRALGRRHADDCRPQVLRPEGHRRAVAEARRAARVAGHRRQAGAQPPRRHRERAGAGRPRRGRRDRADEARGRGAAVERAARSPRSRHACRTSRAPSATAPRRRACRTRPTSASIASKRNRS